MISANNSSPVASNNEITRARSLAADILVGPRDGKTQIAIGKLPHGVPGIRSRGYLDHGDQIIGVSASCGTTWIRSRSPVCLRLFVGGVRNMMPKSQKNI